MYQRAPLLVSEAVRTPPQDLAGPLPPSISDGVSPVFRRSTELKVVRFLSSTNHVPDRTKIRQLNFNLEARIIELLKLLMSWRGLVKIADPQLCKGTLALILIIFSNMNQGQWSFDSQVFNDVALLVFVKISSYHLVLLGEGPFSSHGAADSAGHKSGLFRRAICAYKLLGLDQLLHNSVLEMKVGGIIELNKLK